MSQSNTFNIGVDFQVFESYVSSTGDLPSVIDLSGIPDCITLPDGGTFKTKSTSKSVQVGVRMKNLGDYASQEHPPLFYFPNVGSFSYRDGNWFIKDLSFYSKEGKTPNQESVFGEDIGLKLSLMQGITSTQSVDFRLHFQIQYWENGTLKVYSCFIDPKLKVSHPPSTPPPAV